MRHARQPAFSYQMLVPLQPGWYRIASRNPVRVRRLVTPFHKTRHGCGMRFRTAKRLHRPLAFPRGQSPKRPTSVHEESSAEEPRRTRHLALTQKGDPHECRKIAQRSNPKPRDRGKHSLSILSEKNLEPRLTADSCNSSTLRIGLTRVNVSDTDRYPSADFECNGDVTPIIRMLIYRVSPTDGH
jgi:hypothetical protein